MVTGAVAAIVYGEPRLTMDVDLVVVLPRHQLPDLAASFAPPDFYFPPLEIVEAEIARPRGGHFKIIHASTALKADIYRRGDDPLNHWGLDRRQAIVVDPEIVWTTPPEYVVLRKLEYWRDGGSDKHVRDIRSMLRVLETIDRELISREAERLGVAREWALATE